jgi:hypothetical protein
MRLESFQAGSLLAPRRVPNVVFDGLLGLTSVGRGGWCDEEWRHHLLLGPQESTSMSRFPWKILRVGDARLRGRRVIVVKCDNSNAAQIEFVLHGGREVISSLRAVIEADMEL